jgi:hypothetical protein
MFELITIRIDPGVPFFVDKADKYAFAESQSFWYFV